LTGQLAKGTGPDDNISLQLNGTVKSGKRIQPFA
jgi:hypothetical protein